MYNPETSPEQASSGRAKRLSQVRHIVGQLLNEREFSVETERTGLRVSLQGGISVYLHAGDERLSTVGEVDIMSLDTFFEVSFSPHSLEDEAMGVVARSIYKVGPRGIRVARKQKADVALPDPEEQERPANDTESLRLSAALGRFLFRQDD